MADDKSKEGIEFDPDKVAAFLEDAAENISIPPKSNIERLRIPQVNAAVRKMLARGASSKMIADALNQSGGFNIKPSSFVTSWRRANKETAGDDDAKQGRKSRKTITRTASGTSEGQKANKPATAETKPITKPEGTASGTPAGTSGGTETGKPEGLTNRLRSEGKGDKSTAESKPARSPNMGGAFDPSNL